MRRPFGGGGGSVDWLIVGLGNPGREHAGTRHNVGFLVADELADRWQLPSGKERFRGRLRQGRPPGPLSDGSRPPAVAILSPQTYMNDAGRSVGPARGSFKVPLDRVLVIHDEIDLPFGQLQLRTGGGLAGHNGLKSIKRELGSAEFRRLRVGVGRPESTDPDIVSSWVLSRFGESDEQVSALVRAAADEVERAVLEGSRSEQVNP
ncbi:MAG TPA: aminoacyl-tRNA hydrolase [Solirubrobacteraceae bacterium]|nr:aminoacyl-tRNA hydrolase [Solirubrobacteraceae bacterium]